MEPVFFGRPALFGVFHPASRSDRGHRGVLLCPPIGHEHTRSHRAIRTLAERLARGGQHALRFDYRGVGDSFGDPAAEADSAPWTQDVLRALDELESLSGAREIQIVGLRLGATLAAAALAARPRSSGGARVSRLLLWDPILSGREFLEVATSLMSRFLADPGRLPPPEPGENRMPADFVLGYSFPHSLRRHLSELDLRRLEPWPSVPTTFMLSEPSDATLSFVERIRADGQAVDCDRVEASEGRWSSYERHEKTLRAGRLIQMIVSRLETT